MTLYLASRSPRRRKLLDQIQVKYKCVDINIDERHLNQETPEDFVRRLALAKAAAGFQQLSESSAMVLAADTAVVVDGVILGKPENRQDGLAMLARLSGRMHHVYTAVAILRSGEGMSSLSVSEVTFRDIHEQERESYWLSGEPADKAGGYAIQGLGAAFIKHLAGSYSGVMGLPLYETCELLEIHGMPVFIGDSTG